MTPQEAMEILRDTPIDIRSSREGDIHTLYATAMIMAQEALEKQIPKSPCTAMSNADFFGNAPKCDDVFVCPECGVFLGYISECEEAYQGRYCPDCGQAIDWSDIDGEC